MFVPIQEAVDQLALTLGDGTGVAQSGR